MTNFLRSESRIAKASVLGTLILSAFSALAQSPGSFIATGRAMHRRLAHTATLLNDGRVLITGGFTYPIGNEPLREAELYDPATGTFAPTGLMSIARAWGTATLLPDGRVLITGGYESADLASAEIYDPAKGTFSPTGKMALARRGHSATLLGNGKVVINGGDFFGRANPEFYDPDTGVFTPAEKVGGSGMGSTATRLANGSVLFTGGWPSVWPSLYDPASGTFHYFLSEPTPQGASSTLLADGTVLFTGGVSDDYREEVSQQASIYNSDLGTFQSAGGLMEARDGHTTTLLPDGDVLVTGGYNGVGNSTGPKASTELYHPPTGTFRYAAPMTTARDGHTATLLRDGTVLLAGGRDDRPAELYLRPF